MASGTIKSNRKAVTNFSPSNMTVTPGNCYYSIEGNMMLISIVAPTNAAAATSITLVSDFKTTFGKTIAGRAHNYVWNGAALDIRLNAHGNALTLESNSAIPNNTNIYGQIIVPII